MKKRITLIILIFVSTNSFAEYMSQHYRWSTDKQTEKHEKANLYSKSKQDISNQGLYYYSYRVYDSNAGRWTQRDPIDYQDSINLYQFCGNNPVNNIDALGLEVDATFNRKKGKLTVTDKDDPSKTVTVDAFSGDGKDKNNPASENKKSVGPIPADNYSILEQAESDNKYRLEADDGTPNDKHDKTDRNLFRLGNFNNSHGCVSISNKKDWEQVKKIIEETKTITVSVKSKSRNPFKRKEKLIKYGNLIVK